MILAGTTELGEWSRKIIEVYMQWFTFFVTANLLVMGWFRSGNKKTEASTGPVPVARLFQGLNVLGSITTGMVGYYVSRNIPEYSHLVVWAAIANVLTLLGIAYVWGLVIPKN